MQMKFGPLLVFFVQALATSFMVTGCTEPQCKEQGVFFSIKTEQGSAINTPFSVVVDDGSVSQGICPHNSAQPAIECRDAAFLFGRQAQKLHLQVRAQGWRTHNSQIEPNYDDSSLAGPGCAQQSVMMQKLPDFECNENYCTGFGGVDGFEQFQSQADANNGELGRSFVVKFYIEKLDGEPSVYFQNTIRNRTHYNFVRTILGRPYTREEFENRTYRGADRTEMAGTVIFYPDLNLTSAALGDTVTAPVSLEFFPSDDINPSQILTAYRLVVERLLFSPLEGNEHRFFYVPAGTTQEAQLETATPAFASQGSLWLRKQELYAGVDQQLLNPGVAFGTLLNLTPEQLEQHIVSFRDILVLDRLPNELPLVGGTITAELQTPLAHVNVAARARGTPNIAVIDAAADLRIKPFLNQLVRFEVTSSDFNIRRAETNEAETFWRERTSGETLVPTADLDRSGLLDFDDIGFADSESVGVKAANVAELWHLLGEKAPHGFAVPFYYYDRFMHYSLVTDELVRAANRDCTDEGRPQYICHDVSRILSPQVKTPLTFAGYAQRLINSPILKGNSALREAALNALRYFMRNTPIDSELVALLQNRVSQEFGLDTVRLRSSTNAEDLDNFSGAGLYRSTSAEAFGDNNVADRIRRVWASIWSWQAFEERSFWNIDHLNVHMAVLVHRAFPDEQANGVLLTQNIADPAAFGMYVNVQKGEVSVTNPENGAIPEVFSIIASPEGIQIARQRFSTLSPSRPILSEEEIRSLYTAARSVHGHFCSLYHENADFYTLDLEFKLVEPERKLIIKQVRPYFESANR